MPKNKDTKPRPVGLTTHNELKRRVAQQEDRVAGLTETVDDMATDLKLIHAIIDTSRKEEEAWPGQPILDPDELSHRVELRKNAQDLSARTHYVEQQAPRPVPSVAHWGDHVDWAAEHAALQTNAPSASNTWRDATGLSSPFPVDDPMEAP